MQGDYSRLKRGNEREGSPRQSALIPEEIMCGGVTLTTERERSSLKASRRFSSALAFKSRRPDTVAGGAPTQRKMELHVEHLLDSAATGPRHGPCVGQRAFLNIKSRHLHPLHKTKRTSFLLLSALTSNPGQTLSSDLSAKKTTTPKQLKILDKSPSTHDEKRHLQKEYVFLVRD
ncbi:hypothetical protein KUCAC02_018922 [Chaenocephalus aceratus]|uniref:Uncharacterized protein n=1 Tax=Chaenocephalus aceratus TaxID=36190 RepID=A0ACB9WA09_CHAAC|nr:hypothetical protein KUCAC02_018922 [Chaenocephalus aceratus]